MLGVISEISSPFGELKSSYPFSVVLIWPHQEIWQGCKRVNLSLVCLQLPGPSMLQWPVWVITLSSKKTKTVIFSFESTYNWLKVYKQWSNCVNSVLSPAPLFYSTRIVTPFTFIICCFSLPTDTCTGEVEIQPACLYCSSAWAVFCVRYAHLGPKAPVQSENCWGKSQLCGTILILDRCLFLEIVGSHW